MENQWIMVNDKKPTEDDFIVIVCVGESMFFPYGLVTAGVYFNKEDKWVIYEGSGSLDDMCAVSQNVIKWMRMPKP